MVKRGVRFKDGNAGGARSTVIGGESAASPRGYSEHLAAVLVCAALKKVSEDEQYTQEGG